MGVDYKITSDTSKAPQPHGTMEAMEPRAYLCSLLLFSPPSPSLLSFPLCTSPSLSPAWILLLIQQFIGDATLVTHPWYQHFPLSQPSFLCSPLPTHRTSEKNQVLSQKTRYQSDENKDLAEECSVQTPKGRWWSRRLMQEHYPVRRNQDWVKSQELRKNPGQ